MGFLKKFIGGRQGRAIGGFRVPEVPPLSSEDRKIVEKFAELYYRRWHLQKGGTIDLSWLGYKTLKCPTDLWTYQEIIVSCHINTVIECGTRFGGSAYFFACLFDMLGRGRVITIDNGDPGNVDVDGVVRTLPQHPRIEYVRGSSVDPEIVSAVKSRLTSEDRVLAVLDSDHRAPHVLAEMRAYGPMVSEGSYLIVEDTNINGHPALPEYGPGPWEAVDEFLKTDRNFEPDPSRERFLLTMNPRGFLKRRRPS